MQGVSYTNNSAQTLSLGTYLYCKISCENEANIFSVIIMCAVITMKCANSIKPMQPSDVVPGPRTSFGLEAEGTVRNIRDSLLINYPKRADTRSRPL